MNPQTTSIIKWVIAAGIAVGIFMTIHSCNKQGWFKPSPPDTVIVKHDTTLYVTRDSLVYVPKYQVIHDTALYPVNIPGIPKFTDTTAMVLDWLEKRVVIDTLYKSKYGYVMLTDTVWLNRIMSRMVKDSIVIPTITNTVTLTQPKKIIAYIGVDVAGFPFLAGASLGIKFRNDNYFGVKAFIFKGKPIYGGQVMIPIRLHK